MGLFKKFFGEKKEEVYTPDLVEKQIAAREAQKNKPKSFFEKVAEKASSVVSGLRGVFGKKAMSVLDETEAEIEGGFNQLSGLIDTSGYKDLSPEVKCFEEERIELIMDPEVTSGALAENGEFVYTRRSKREIPREGRKAFGRVGRSMWLEKNRARRNPNGGRGVRRTGTDSGRSYGMAAPRRSPVVNYEVGNSKVHSIYMLKYGVDVNRLETAYLNNQESGESILSRMEFRVPSQYRIPLLKLVNDCSKGLFVESELQGSVLGDFLEGLTELKVSKDDMPRICVDLAKYAGTIVEDNKEVVLEMSDPERITQLEKKLDEERERRKAMEEQVGKNTVKIEKFDREVEDMRFIIDGVIKGIDGFDGFGRRKFSRDLNEGKDLQDPELPEGYEGRSFGGFGGSDMLEMKIVSNEFNREDGSGTNPRISGAWKKMN